VASMLNALLCRKRPTTISSSWILRHAPACYRFIRKWIRTETGDIDWDRVTYVLDPAYQRRWKPRKRRKRVGYADADEVNLILNRYRDKLYVFVAASDVSERRTRDRISISLVRIAQKGNILAKRKLMDLVADTINDWIEHHPFLFPWRGYREELRGQVDGCIRRYRYTGSFIRYLYKTLEYAARGIRPLIAYSLDEPSPSGRGRRIDLIAQQATTPKATVHGWRRS
jgi:hypothetical protein